MENICQCPSFKSQGAFMANTKWEDDIIQLIISIFFILQLTWLVLRWIQDIDCKYWKCFHLAKSYWTFKGLTWAAACSSSLTVKPFALWPRSVLTMWCSTTWFGGSVTGFSVLCQKKKEKNGQGNKRNNKKNWNSTMKNTTKTCFTNVSNNTLP